MDNVGGWLVSLSERTLWQTAYMWCDHPASNRIPSMSYDYFFLRTPCQNRLMTILHANDTSSRHLTSAIRVGQIIKKVAPAPNGKPINRQELGGTLVHHTYAHEPKSIASLREGPRRSCLGIDFFPGRALQIFLGRGRAADRKAKGETFFWKKISSSWIHVNFWKSLTWKNLGYHQGQLGKFLSSNTVLPQVFNLSPSEKWIQLAAQVTLCW